VAVEVRAEERGGSGALTVASTDRWDPADEDGWHVATTIRVSEAAYGVLSARGADGTLPPNSTQVCQIIADQLGLYHFLRETLRDLRDTQKALERILASQAMALEDIKHQLVSPLVAATVKTEGILQSGRFDGRTDVHLRAVRGLCRRAGRVALSAGIFSMLSKGQLPSPKSELLSVDELLRLMILCADDAQVLIDPRRKIRVDVDRSSFRSVGRRLVQADRSFLEQCVGNLVDNAAKYSYDGTTVGICGTVAEASLAICVSSCGIPIQPADVDRCLRRNWRGRAARTATGEGSGLGLWIVDNLIRSMAGAVDIAVAGDATAVSLRLPFARTAP
jgi:signal transduction histidine kinase